MKEKQNNKLDSLQKEISSKAQQMNQNQEETESKNKELQQMERFNAKMKRDFEYILIKKNQDLMNMQQKMQQMDQSMQSMYMNNVNIINGQKLKIKELVDDKKNASELTSRIAELESQLDQSISKFNAIEKRRKIKDEDKNKDKPVLNTTKITKLSLATDLNGKSINFMK